MENNQDEVLDFISSALKDALARAKEQFKVQLSADQLANAFSNVKTWSVEEKKGKTKRRRLNKTSIHEEQVSTFMIDSRTLEEKVFGNYLLASKIFGYLKKSDQLDCRVVHPRWKESIVIGKNGDGIVFSKLLDRFFLNGSNWKSLDLFTEFLKYSDNSSSFPCTGYEFKDANIGNEDAQRFFDFFGSSIKNLKLDMDGQSGRRWREKFVKPKNGFSKEWTDPRVIGTLLTSQARNVQELTISFPSNSFWPGYKKLIFFSGAPKDPKIPNLTTIKYHPPGPNSIPGQTDSDILSQLLRAAINLKKFELTGRKFLMGKYLSIIESTGKALTVKKVTFTPNDESEIPPYEKFTACRPELEKLTLDLEKINKNSQLWSKVSILSTLLVSSQNSLRKISFHGSLGFLSRSITTVPKFGSVKKIKLQVTTVRSNNNNNSTNNASVSNKDNEENGDKDDDKKDAENLQVDNSSLFLPHGVNFSDTFPVLQTIKIQVTTALPQDEGLLSWTKYFPMDDSLPTVKILKITPKIIPNFWIEKFGEMFPKLEMLTLQGVVDFPTVAPAIWSSYPELIHLKLELNMTTNANYGRVLDKAFTGFTSEQLGNSNSRLPDAEDATSSSILEMKNLKLLHLVFNFHNQVRMGNNRVLCLNVGRDYLGELDNLSSVTISVKGFRRHSSKVSSFKKALKTLARYKVQVLDG